MSKPAFTIPTVDISAYLENSDSADAQKVVEKIKHACKTSGFFQIVNHGIPQTLQKEVLEAATKLFNLPQSEKLKLRSANGRGYEMIGTQVLEPGTNPDLKEGFFVGPDIPDDQEKYRDFRYPNKWPAESLMRASELKTPLLDYRDRLCNLAVKVMRILAEGIPNGSRHMFDPFCEDPLAVVRLLHYPPQKNLEDKKQLGAGAHTDFGAITLLLQDSAGGLQVLNQSTKEWIDVPPNDEAYVVNVGDMLEIWTKGGYKSNTHRVINKSGGHRYSVPFFFDGNLEYVLKPLDGSSAKGVTVEEFMKERFVRAYIS